MIDNDEFGWCLLSHGNVTFFHYKHDAYLEGKKLTIPWQVVPVYETKDEDYRVQMNQYTKNLENRIGELESKLRIARKAMKEAIVLGIDPVEVYLTQSSEIRSLKASVFSALDIPLALCNDAVVFVEDK